jgi:hypothetical protein
MKITRLIPRVPKIPRIPKIPKVAKTIKNTEVPDSNEKEADGETSQSSIYSDNGAIQGHEDPTIAPTQLKKKKKKKKIPGFFQRSMPYS